jgi:hypothetical protein
MKMASILLHPLIWVYPLNSQRTEYQKHAADFAPNQKRLILAEEHPDWPGEEVDLEARRQVFGERGETPESVIIAKLRAYAASRPARYLDDTASIARQQRSKLDQKRLDTVTAGLGLLGVWRPLWEGNRGR